MLNGNDWVGGATACVTGCVVTGWAVQLCGCVVTGATACVTGCVVAGWVVHLLGVTEWAAQLDLLESAHQISCQSFQDTISSMRQGHKSADQALTTMTEQVRHYHSHCRLIVNIPLARPCKCSPT